MKYRVFRTLPLFVVLSAVAFAQDLASFEKRITVKKLNNGLTVVICERPEAPVFAFFTHVDAGSVQDPLGETGLAHMFEHMAFKGTDKIGTTDYAAEKVARKKWRKPTQPIPRSATKAWAAMSKSSRNCTKPGRTLSLKPKSTSSRTSFPRSWRATVPRALMLSPAKTKPRTTTRCQKTGWSCGHTSNRSASCTPSCASFTKSGMW